ncbi:MAG: two-component system, OmpR family, sensor kinase [Streptosporangiaceae bacterium]|jgi:two-component system OmpR family sensor kinase|nr:two-component system, OmpR family, sensor kinase [Streptosporangiaceae bacterium]
MSFKSGRGGFWERLRRLPDRTPLRVKMITALLALVAIALTTISVAGLIAFQSYLRDQAAHEVNVVFGERASQLSGQSGSFGPRSGLRLDEFGLYGNYLVELLNPQGQVLAPSAASGSGPSVPTSKDWLKAHSGRLVIVPSQSGSDKWQIIAKQYTVNVQTGFQVSPPQTVILVVGTDLGNVDQTIRQLAGIDLIVSTIILVGLVVVGIAIVRASLRPLTDIEHTAEAIAAGDLTRRVPDRDPVTEVGRLGRSLNTMLAQIETSFRAREESEAAARRSEERMRRFVADASHELRTPLTAMRGYAEYYRQRGGVQDEAAEGASVAANGGGQYTHGPLSRADLNRIMQRVEQESARMGVLVEDMLLLARLDQQRPIEHRPVDVLTLAADAVQDARMIAPQRTIELTVGTGAAFLVLGDEVRLRQVIGNLMSNALNHTPDGTPVGVRILAGPRHPVPSVVLEVTDQGPGLRPDQAERVFERFYRADTARTRTAGGTGLGLAIVAALVAAHGGTVDLDTAPGRGATFRITLPLAPEARSDQSGDDEPLITDTTGPTLD